MAFWWKIIREILKKDVELNGWDENKEKERLYKNENDGMELSLKEFHQREPCNGRLFSAISGSKDDA